MSKQLKKSIKIVNLYQSNTKSIGQKHCSRPNIKTIEIFMKDIDKQIEQSYTKLKTSKQKQSHLKRSSQFFNDTMLYEEKSMEDTTTVGMSPHGKLTNFSTNQIEKDNITLINNKDVMEYINLVYEIYSIKDPMKESNKKQSQMNQTRPTRPLAERHYSTNKKIRDFKQSFQKTIGSASTLKNSFNFHEIQLNPFRSIPQKLQSSLQKKSCTFGTKVQVISLHTKNAKSQVNDETNSKRQFMKASNVSLVNSNVLSNKKKLTIKQSQHHKRNSCHNIDLTGPVPQLFRYCFMCEDPILQQNLSIHEQTCLPLKNALTNQEMPQILFLLDQKITRLIAEINGQLIFKDERQISKDFLNIKSSVKNWMNKLPIVENSSTKSYQMEWRSQFNKISETINQSVCKAFQSINKLQWFSRLKENIGNKYMIKC